MDDDEQPATPPLVRPKARFLATNGRHGSYKKLPPTTPTDRGRWLYVEDDEDGDDDLGYASTAFRALPHEPECVGPAILESYADVNRRIFTQQHILDVAEAQQRRPELTPQNRLDDIHRRAKQGRYDELSRPVHVIQKEIDKARLRGQPVGQRTLERLEALEALLDGVSVARLAA